MVTEVPAGNDVTNESKRVPTEALLAKKVASVKNIKAKPVYEAAVLAAIAVIDMSLPEPLTEDLPGNDDKIIRVCGTPPIVMYELVIDEITVPAASFTREVPVPETVKKGKT